MSANNFPFDLSQCEIRMTRPRTRQHYAAEVHYVCNRVTVEVTPYATKTPVVVIDQSSDGLNRVRRMQVKLSRSSDVGNFIEMLRTVVATNAMPDIPCGPLFEDHPLPPLNNVNRSITV